jgi:WD40 repeat protein
LTFGSDGTVKLWDLATSESRGRLLGQHGRVARFSPDGRTLASVTSDGRLELWDSAAGRKLRQLGKWSPRADVGLAFSADGKILASANPDAATICLWDVERAALLRELPAGGYASFLAFSGDGRRLVGNCGRPDDKNPKPGGGHQLTVWDLTDSRSTTPLVCVANVTQWAQAAVSTDARLAALIDDTGPALYDLTSGRRLASLQASIRQFAFSPDGEAVAGAGYDHTVRVWNSRTGELLWQRDHDGWVLSVDFSHDGGRLLSTSSDGTARTWNARTGEGLVVMTHRGHVNGARFSRDGRLVVTASNDNTARVWESATGQPVTPPLLHDGTVTREVGFSADTSRLFTVSTTPRAYQLRLWELSRLTQPLPSLKRLVTTLACREPGGDGLLLYHAASADTWEELRRQWPEGFRATREQEIGWHLREAHEVLDSR